MRKAIAVIAALAFAGVAPVSAQDADMSFFITSAGPGDGANLDGLAGADQHCEDLAYAAGFGDLRWRAYLSALESNGTMAVNARDRIGSGPWYNFSGDMIARDVTDLHSDDANLTKESILTEKGSIVNGRGDDPNMHDLMTGSNLDGTAYVGDESYTACDNWTSNGAGSTRVGHHDRQGGGENPTSWNSAHNSRGCSQTDLQGSGGNGFFFCFATDGNGAPQQAARTEND
ncbi:MAG: hypothetical protein ACKVG4_08640 [Longimicrobiales bacterium]